MVHPFLKEVPSRNQFWVADGRSLKNLEELAFALQDMDETTFRRHVNEHKNDFHNWVRDVHQDRKLAGTLLKIKQKERAFHAVQERIQELIPKQSHSQKKEKIFKKNSTFRKNVILKKNTISQGENVSFPAPPSVSRDMLPTVWIVIIGTVLAVAFVSTTSHAVVTGAAVGDVIERGTSLIGVTFFITGILFIVAAVRKPKHVEKLSLKKQKKKSRRRKKQ